MDPDLQEIIDAQPGLRKNGRWKIDPKLAITIIGWLITLALAWGKVDTRMSVTESKQAEFERRLDRFESKLDTLLQRP